MSSDSFYLQHISNTNKSGNSLLANRFALKSTENRKIVNISNLLKKSSKQIERYRNEKAKLQTLQIAVCHIALDEKRCDEYQEFCKDAEKSMLKIERILNQHLKYNAARILSKEEFEEIERENLVEKLENELDEAEELLFNDPKTPSIAGDVTRVSTKLQERLRSIRELESSLESTMKLVKETGKGVNKIQHEAVSNTAEVLESLADR